MRLQEIKEEIIEALQDAEHGIVVKRVEYLINRIEELEAEKEELIMEMRVMSERSE